MQFYLNGYRPGDPDIFPEAVGTANRPAGLPDTVDVLVVGSGPAGLSAAFQLARRGYKVTIFESLPEAGGILYSDEMRVFYELFYRQPKAPWRYQVGYEPGLMPPEDLKVYRQILTARTTQAFAPWVAKMRPQDRLIIRSVGEQPPAIGGLEWQHLGGEIWSGRKGP